MLHAEVFRAQSKNTETVGWASILYFKTTETRSWNKSISWLQGECELNVILKTLEVSCDKIVYERFSLASFRKYQNKLKMGQIFHCLILW